MEKDGEIKMLRKPESGKAVWGDQDTAAATHRPVGGATFAHSTGRGSLLGVHVALGTHEGCLGQSSHQLFI